MRQIIKPILFVGTMLLANMLSAQNQIAAKADTTKKTEAPKAAAASNVMLNASSDNGPRVVNIGLPASIGGTTILENGLPVVYSFFGESPTRVWRASSSFSKFSVLSVAETAISIGDVGVSVSTYSNKGTEKMQVAGALNSNHFGLVRGDLTVSGPLKRGFYYSASAFVNMDPGTFKTDFSTFLDKTQIYKFVLNKKYKKGEIGIQYKYADSKGFTTKVSPYVYSLDGTVKQFGDFKIGRDSYLERTGKTPVINPLTGQREVWDQMDDMGSRNHVIDLLGNHKFDNGVRLDYIVRYDNAKSGLYNPYYSGVSTVNPKANRYFYLDNPTEEYKSSHIQNVLSLANPKGQLNTIMSRFDISKKTDRHHWSVGLNEWYYNVGDLITASSSFVQEVGANPRKLIRQDSVKGGGWANKSDEYGHFGYNTALQYYSGSENKLALFATEKWTVSDQVELNFGARIEWQRVDGKWYPKASRDAAEKDGFTNGQIDMNRRVSVKKDWYNKAFSASFLYKIVPAFGVLGDVSYTEVAGNLSSYSGADDPGIEPSQIPGASAGVYFNHPLVSIVSKATYIQRNNFKNNSTFQGGYKQTITYGVETVGWTTDMVVSPFKGFKLHMLLTLQAPKYKDFIVDLSDVAAEGNMIHDFSGGTARSVSKTIIEFDPSYTYKNFRIWASGRYFSKEAANYPNTLFFAGRFETFAGINYKVNKQLDLSMNVVNLLNQKGAQGSISGTNTTTAEQAQKLEGKVLTGTYMRPLTVEFGLKFKFVSK